MKNSHLYLIVSTVILASCGGGGGGGGGSTPTTPTTPAPTVNLSADPTSVLLESTSTLTWSSSNASSCSADWTSQTFTSGSEAVTISTAGDNSFSISCTGDGGSRSASVTVEGYRNTEGVVVDGYISGAEVCIDENDNWICDWSPFENIWKQSGTNIPPIDGNEIRGKLVLSSDGSKLLLPSSTISADSSGNKKGSLQLYFLPEN